MPLLNAQFQVNNSVPYKTEIPHDKHFRFKMSIGLSLSLVLVLGHIFGRSISFSSSVEFDLSIMTTNFHVSEKFKQKYLPGFNAILIRFQYNYYNNRQTPKRQNSPKLIVKSLI
jgi:hypothetical protein